MQGDFADLNRAMCDYYTANKDRVMQGSTRLIQLGVYNIEIRLNGTGGSIVSSLGGGANHQYSAAINGMESLLLALACSGVDVTTPKVKEAIETTVDAISNQY